MFSVCAKTCSNHDSGHMNMTITFVFTLTATSPVKRCIFVVVSSGVSNTFVNVLLSSVVTLCSHFLFTDNIHHLVPGLVPVRSLLNHVILLDSFAILSSQNDPFQNKRS